MSIVSDMLLHPRHQSGKIRQNQHSSAEDSSRIAGGAGCLPKKSPLYALILLCELLTGCRGSVSFSRGAGAAPLPEREVSSQTPFFFRCVPPQAAHNEN